jgi:peptidoglycan/LPS O-acetylase OafA/YrhL
MTAREAGLLAAASLAAMSLATGLTASRLDAPSQREIATGLAVLALYELGLALDTPPVPAAIVAAAAGLIAIGVWIALWRFRPRSPWTRSAIVVAIVGDVAALLIAASVLPRGDVLEVALLLTGLECATAGVILGRTHLLAISPLFPTIAWLVYAAEAFRGEVQWFTVPSGIALLALVTIERRGREKAGAVPRTPELLAIEYTGMVSVVAASLVQIVAISPLRGPLAIGLGIGLATWGALTRVRRRAAFGAGTVAFALILLVAVPIADLVPAMRGPALWLVLAGAGLAFILVATMLERGRTKVREVLHRLDDLTAGWE